MSIRTPEQVKAELERNGISIAEWAAANGFNTNLVYEVLRGGRKCKRGQSHRVAVLLGLKAGAIASVKELQFSKAGA